MEFGVRDYKEFMCKHAHDQSKHDDYLEKRFEPLTTQEIMDVCSNEIAQMMTFGWLKNEKGRKLINGLKRIINHATWNAHAWQIQRDLNLAESTAKKIATRAYARHYAVINNNMQEALKTLLEIYS